MMHAKKMLLVPATSDAYAQHMVPPAVPQMINLDGEIRQILDTPNVPADVKLVNYNQVLRRYMKMHNDFMGTQYPQLAKSHSFESPPPPPPGTQGRRPETVEEDSETPALPFSDNYILSGVPAKLRNTASLFVDFLKRTKDIIGWTAKGEMVVNGKMIPNSNLVDLVHDFARQRKRAPAEGSDVLAEILMSHNVPRECVGNEERWRLMERHKGKSPLTPASGSKRSQYVTPPNAPSTVKHISRVRKAPNFYWQEFPD